jgi:hypothetical protein
MIASELMALARKDFLYDTLQPYVWDDDFLLRAILESERQACMRWNLIFDNSEPSYSSQLVIAQNVVEQLGTSLVAHSPVSKIPLLNNVDSYTISDKITFINDTHYLNSHGYKHEIKKVSKDTEMHCLPRYTNVKYCQIRGRSMRIWPKPDASKDATFLTDPTGTLTYGQTWYDNGNLYQYNGSAWVLMPNAPLGFIEMDLYRLPMASTITADYVPEIPEEHQFYLIYWIMYRAYLKKDPTKTDDAAYDPSRSAYGLGEFNAYFGKPKNADVRQAMIESPRQLSFRPAGYNIHETLG